MANKKLLLVQALFISPILGAILGFLFAQMLHKGWFDSPWQMIEKPPVQVRVLEAINGDSLWLRSVSDVIYYNENASTCQMACWHPVSKISIPAKRPAETQVIHKACAPALPLFFITTSIAECRSDMWVDRSFMFALLNDGNIYFWHADIYEEWAFFLFMSGAIVGAVVLFVLTLICVLFSTLLDWLSNKARSKQVQS